ncbi:hypothetical protein HQ576_20450 [bacterium]|nr:hypothetical protein [bacterium]
MEGRKRLIAWFDCIASLLAAGLIGALVIGLTRAERGGAADTLGMSKALFGTLALVLAIALATFGSLRFYTVIIRNRQGSYLFFDTPDGQVRIRSASVEQVINRAVRCMDDVADARAALFLPRGARVPTKVRVRCRLYDRPNVLAIQDQIRALVCDRYLEMFPTEEPLPVEVAIEGITFETPGPKVPPKPHPKRTKGAKGEPDDQHPFRPQYPVDS